MTEPRQPLLVVEDVEKHFPGVQALKGVSLTLAAGEVHGLVGQNGAGKSTLVKCVSGVYAPDGGRIVFDGEPIGAYSPKHAVDLGVAVVHQRAQLLPWLSVAENVLLGQMPTRRGVIDRRRANAMTRELLERFRLEIDPEAPVAHLATPERQQVAIAKALFRKAKLLILDEPTAALDATRAERLFALIEDLRRHDVGVLYVSHHLEEVFRLADRITVLRDGQLVATRPAAELDQGEVVTLMAGRRLEAPPAASARAATGNGKAEAVALAAVSTDVLHEVALEVHEGEVVGVTGVIGAGGHEIARLLFGLDRPLAGALRLGGRPYRPRGPRDAIAHGLFVVPEDGAQDGLVPWLSITANVTLVDLGRVTRLGLLALGRERSVARGFVERLQIAARSLETPVRTLSGGNQQKVLLAKALAAEARVLVLEEPTQGVDVHAKAEIHRIVRTLAAEGKAVIVISTDIRDLLEFVDRVVALRDGRIVEDVAARETSYAELLDLTVGAVKEAAS